MGSTCLNRKYQPYPLLSYFSLVVCLRCLLHHILSLIAYTFRENMDFVFIIIAFWLADRVRFFAHYTVLLSSLCKLVWRHWTYKMPVRYILSSVWVRLSIFPHLSIIQDMELCILSLSLSLVMIARMYMYTLFFIITKSEVWPIIHCSGHETKVCAVCRSILFLNINCLVVEVRLLYYVFRLVQFVHVVRNIAFAAVPMRSYFCYACITGGPWWGNTICQTTQLHVYNHTRNSKE